MPTDYTPENATDTVPPTEATEITGTTSDQPKGWRDVLPIHPAAELFPLMSEAELKELAADIDKHGLTEPICIYDDPELGLCVLDGRNRLDAFERLNWEAGACAYEPPSERQPLPVGLYQWVERKVDPFAYVLSKNAHRRHLSLELKRELLIKVIAAQPEKSDRQIAGIVKADHKTVAVARKAGENVGRIPHVAKRIDKKGRKQPAKKSKLVNPKKATVEQDRQAVIALDQKARDAERELARADASASAEKRKAEYAGNEAPVTSYDLATLREAMAEVEVQAAAGNATRLKEALRWLQREAGVALEADCVIAIPAVLQ